LRAEGVIPAHLRFQVGLPFALSGLSGLKENFAADYPIASRGYEDMVAHELERLTVEVPPEELAIQWDVCYEVLDIEGGLLVRMANYAVANSGRTVDWLHLAGPRYLRSEDDRFFRPLRELRVGHTRVFLGIVLPIDGIPGLRRGKATAARYLTDFGVAM